MWAAAHDAHAGGDEAPGVRGHVFRRAEVDVAAVHEGGSAGVGHRRHLHPRGRGGHTADGVEHRLRPLAAVGPDHGDVPLLHRAHHVFRLVAVEGRAFLVEGERDDDGQLREGLDRGDRGPGLVERGHRLEQEQVHAAFDEAFRLLAVGGDGLVEADVAEGLERLAQRSDRARHQGLALRGGPSDAGALAVDLGDLVLEAVGAELEAVGPERVGLDDLRSRLDVLLVHALDEAGVGEVQLVEAPVHEDAAGVQHRAHGAVAHDDTFGDALLEGLHARRLGLRSAHDQSSLARRLGQRQMPAPAMT